MLRYLYLLSLLFYINISFCYEYSEESDESRPCNRKLRVNTNVGRPRRVEQKRVRNRRDYETYDKEPVAQIDVASFIKDPEDGSLEENDPYDLQTNKMKYDNYNDVGLIGKITNEKEDDNEYYAEKDSENLKENSEKSNVDSNFVERINQNKAKESFELIDDMEDHLNRKKNMHYHDKKSALRHIKLPFFSRKFSTPTKGKKQKKRKLYSLKNKPKTIKASASASASAKTNTEKLAKQNGEHEKQHTFRNNEYNINKRSYFERLCPACKQKFVINSKKLRNIYDTMLSNDKNNEVTETKIEDMHNSYIDSNDVNEEKDFVKRKKREDDTRNVERQKLDKKVESVSVNNP